MSDIAIQVEGLGKQYHIGRQQAGYETIRETISRTALSPFRKAGRLLRGQASAAAGLDETIWALRDVSFEVQHGEVLGIIGRNGAGKSTLLKILSRITEPTEGYADVYGRIGSLLEVGTGFHPELTGRENLYLNGAVLGMRRSEIASKFDEIIAFAEVEKFVDTPVKHYSSGMYLRLAFAVAAHLDPEILVIDEVLAVGDAVFQKKCLGKMEEVSKEGRTVLFVSHNLPSIQRLCPRTILLNAGNVIFDGNTQQTLEKYLVEMRLLESRVTAIDTIPRKVGLGKLLRFYECQLHDSSGKPNNQIRFGSSFSVCVGFIAMSHVKNVSVIIGISTETEFRITTVASEEDQRLFSIMPEQNLQVCAIFNDLILKPGRYTLTIGLRTGKIGLDHLPHVRSFEVSEISTETFVNNNAETWGTVHTSATWMMDKV